MTPGKSWFFTCSIVLMALLNSCTLSTSGTNDETLVRTAKIYNSDYSPAEGVTVRVFPVNDTTRVPVFQTSTASSGEYSLDVTEGIYNVLAGDDYLGTFQDSVIIRADYSTLSDDTLDQTIVLKGKVLMEPIHDPRTVTIQVLGTGKYANVNSDGQFYLTALPEGEYVLLSLSTVDQYTPVYQSFTVSSSESDTMELTVAMIYTGIPVVRNLTASYDTLQGTVTLVWDASGYFLLRDYVIYRAFGDSVTPTFSEIGLATEATFTDTVPGVVPSLDLLYRVIVRSETMETGTAYQAVSITRVEPFKAEIHASDCCLGVPCTLQAVMSGYPGSTVTFAWDIGGTGTFSESSGSDTVIIVKDTLTKAYQCILKVEVDNRLVLYDTTTLSINIHWNKIGPKLTDDIVSIHTVGLSGQLITFCKDKDKRSIWGSNNGETWNLLNDSLQFDLYDCKPVVYNDTLCYVDSEGYLWLSGDAVEWVRSDEPICSTSIQYMTATGPTVGSKRAPTLFVDAGKLCMEPFLATAQENLLLTTDDLEHWTIEAFKAYGKIVYSFTSINNTTALCGFNWGMNLGIWIGIRNAEAINLLTVDYETSSTSSADSYSMVAFMGQLLFCTNHQKYLIIYLSRNEQSIALYPPEFTENIPPSGSTAVPSLIVFNNDLYAITSNGIFRASR